MSNKSKRVFPNSTVNAFHEDGDVKIVESTLEHAAYLQHHLRPSDVRECLIHGATPWRALHAPLASKKAITWTGMYKDTPACMFGVVPYQMTDDYVAGTVWLLGTEVLETEYRKFLRVSKNMSDWLLEHYDFLENVVPIDHEHTIKWLDWMGFAFGEEPVVINGYLCTRFVRCIDTIEVRFE